MATLLQVDSEDASFLFSERWDNPAHLSLICLYNQSCVEGGVVRFQHLRELIANRLQTTPVLKQRLKRIPADLDYPYWVDDTSFDIDYHVRHLALPHPGDWRQFCIQIARLHSRSVDTRRPLWEIYVIEGLNALPDLPKGSFALYFKVHHCAMDQFTAMEFINSIHEHSPNAAQHKETVPHVRHIPVRSPTPAEILVNGAVGNSLRLASLALPPWRQYRRLGSYLRAHSLNDTRLATGDETDISRQPHFAITTSAARVFEGLTIPLDNLHRLCAAVPGSDVNHALTLICSEATRRYLDHQGIGNNRHIVARMYCPTGTAGAHAVAGNTHAFNEVECYSAIDNLLDRLTAISSVVNYQEEHDLETRSRLMRARYEDLPALFNHFLSQQSMHMLAPAEEAESVAIHLIESSEQTLYLLGAKLAAVTGIGPLADGCGLVFSASFYDNNVHLSFTAEREKLPKPALLRNELEKLMLELDQQL